MSAIIAPLEIVRDQILDRFLESCIKNYPLEGYLQRFERLELAHLPMQAQAPVHIVPRIFFRHSAR